MKNTKFYMAGLLFLAISATTFGQKLMRPSTETITLMIEQASGTNAAAVAYNPSEKIYYTSFAGNEK